jgi:hypothetical protein
VLPFGTSFLAIAAALILPSLVSFLLVAAIAMRADAKYLAAYAVGIYLWFFSDTIGDSTFFTAFGAASGSDATLIRGAWISLPKSRFELHL